jgi:hypothetical protein
MRGLTKTVGESRSDCLGDIHNDDTLPYSATIWRFGVADGKGSVLGTSVNASPINQGHKQRLERKTRP